jgi:hypothetical protein
VVKDLNHSREAPISLFRRSPIAENQGAARLTAASNGAQPEMSLMGSLHDPAFPFGNASGLLLVL